MGKMCLFLLLVFSLAGLLLAGGCGGGGPLGCGDYIDKTFECSQVDDPTGQLRDANLQVCGQWNKVYKTELLEALDLCNDLAECTEFQVCVAEAHQLCEADITAQVDDLCEKVVECQWDDITAMEQCREEMSYARMLHTCLKPEVFAEYIRCSTGITCGEDSDFEWTMCYVNTIAM